ncbi:hypothetical protein [Marinospirillum alkaliphilum]|uniref:Uncharacterized protein n=1 Tax=Marinospirillum alkaliphilum DSM 21637 TaxID=1122209 RepID=A0A1K1Z753_9GAMM|nr:hypothetical protein [Marinospirillum alkaliphilum]SFX69934.1 hypothetical protein SAMN02745752_02572 [Marinospirillum alkaliphilum DSM 21637]
MSTLSAQQRYATLQVMGTRLWVPRVRLPGAAVSVACDWPTPAPVLSGRERLQQQMVDLRLDTAPHTENTVAPLSPPPSPPVSPILSTADQPQAEAAVVEQVAALARQASRQVVQPVQPLQVDIWLLANGWQLVLEAAQPATGLNEAELRLLQQLLLAFYPGGLGIASQERFVWPLPGVPVLPSDEGELSMALQAFLGGARYRSVQLGGVLCFGERSAAQLQAGSQRHRLLKRDVYQAPALHQLLQQPVLKQSFWQEAGESGLRAAFAASSVVV